MARWVALDNSSRMFRSLIVPFPSFHHPSRDSNAFYYKPSRPDTPQNLYYLECKQWRHDDGEESFHVEIHVSDKQNNVEGVLVCRIQADNLSISVSKNIPIRIKIAHVSAYQNACVMVDTLFNTSDK